MIRKAFIMTVYPNKHDEYYKRHNEIWPELVDMLHEHGVSNYSIYLDEETSKLFAYLEIQDEQKWSKSASTEINQKWWEYMKDIMETNPDSSPITKDLKEVFHLD